MTSPLLHAHSPSGVPAPVGHYAHGLEVPPGWRLLFISGQIPEDPKGAVPADFSEQCRLVWAHVGAVLAAAGLGYEQLVKVTTFLTDRTDAQENGRIRREVLGAHRPALTVVVTGTLDPRWRLEIEGIAVAPPQHPGPGRSMR
jgi:2-iminobutanoate/2-iminopropanoate deaminase